MTSRATAGVLRILLVEDSERDAELLLGELKRGAFEFESRRVQTTADFARELECPPQKLNLAAQEMLS